MRQPSTDPNVRTGRAVGRTAGASPRGHVIGHSLGAPPPRPRDLDRPFGRIGPYGLRGALN